MRTFAAPFEKRDLEKGFKVCFWGFSRKAKEAGRSYLPVMTDWRKKPDKEKAKKKLKASSLKRLKTVQEASTEKKQFIEKR